MDNTAYTIFNARFECALSLAELDYNRELSDFEMEGLQYHVAGQMMDEGLITDINQVIPQ